MSKYGVFLVRIFLYLEWIQENTDQKNSVFVHFLRKEHLSYEHLRMTAYE